MSVRESPSKGGRLRGLGTIPGAKVLPREEPLAASLPYDCPAREDVVKRLAHSDVSRLTHTLRDLCVYARSAIPGVATSTTYRPSG